MAARKTILKVLFSATAAIVLLVSVYFMLGSDLKGYSGLLVNREGQGYAGFLRDLVGRSVELDKQSQAELLAASFKRRMEGESNKVDFLLEQMSADDQAEAVDAAASMRRPPSDLLEFVEAHPFIESALLINGQYEVLLSTSNQKRIGTVLDHDVYREIFTSDVNGSLVNEATGNIVLYRRIQSDHVLLFIYAPEFLDSIFSDIPDFVYSRTVLTADRVILINFPAIEEADRENLRKLSQTVVEQSSGFIRIRHDQFDKTIYFFPVSQVEQQWIVAVTSDTEQVRISHIGVAILVVQVFVVAAIIIFILTTVKERKKIRIGAVSTPRKSMIRGGETAVPGKPGKALMPGGGEEREGASSLSDRQDVISLDDVEEVKHLEEFGEAEIAQEYEEYDEVQPVIDADEGDKSEVDISQQSVEPESESQVSAAGEHIDEEIDEHVEELVQPLNDTTELQKLEAVQREIMGPDAQMLDDIEELEAIEDGEFEPSRDDMGIDEDIEEIPFEEIEGTDDDLEDISFELPPAVDSGESVIDDLAEIDATMPQHEDVIPNLEALVGADASSDISDDILETDFTAVEGHSPESADGRNEDLDGVSIRDTFSRFLQSVGIHKGAVLLKQSTGIYKPCVVTGFSRDTEPKLIFSGKEKIVSKVLMRDKILHIRNNVFMDDELGKKFSNSDTSSIDSVYFAPLMPSRSDLAGFIVLGPTTDESTDSPEVLKKIKEIKKSLTNIL